MKETDRLKITLQVPQYYCVYIAAVFLIVTHSFGEQLVKELFILSVHTF